MLGKAQFHAFETRPDGSPRYDVVIVDAPATGHGLDLLRVPKVIVDVAPPGLLRREAERAWTLFSDPKKSGVLIVTLPEELPTNETIELYRALRGELELPVCGLAVNMLHARLFDEADAKLLKGARDALEANAPASPLLELIETSLARSEREVLEAASKARLAREAPVPQVDLPLLVGRDLRRAEIEQLAQALGHALKSP
jgi:anion-transporting  ArsA/GET3 family ATPase